MSKQENLRKVNPGSKQRLYEQEYAQTKEVFHVPQSILGINRFRGLPLDLWTKNCQSWKGIVYHRRNCSLKKAFVNALESHFNLVFWGISWVTSPRSGCCASQDHKFLILIVRFWLKLQQRLGLADPRIWEGRSSDCCKGRSWNKRCEGSLIM